ncbi:MAG: hypothetical protein EBX55_08990 [Betaproteobacteria bacterium]|nr:hypothetical protein [Betaproteobacteria bacterium]
MRGRLAPAQTIAIGGWATAMIEHFRSADGGQSFEHQERLALSPFLNLSHLVRAPAIALKGGGFILPVYFELGSKYGVLLRFNAQGRFVHRERMDGPPHLLQPWLAIRAAQPALAYESLAALAQCAADRCDCLDSLSGFAAGCLSESAHREPLPVVFAVDACLGSVGATTLVSCLRMGVTRSAESCSGP